MKKLNRVIFTLLFLSLLSACKKIDDQKTPPPGGPELPNGVNSKNVQIIVPKGTPVDLATCEVFSLSLQSSVNKEGKVKVAFNKGYPNIAYVFDKDDNVFLAGFITDSTSTISIGSTAEVLLYYGMGSTFQPYEIMEKFISGIGKVPGVAEWKTELEGIFKNDPLMMQKGLYAGALKSKVESIIKTGEILRKPADITVDANDKRSGLQLAEKGFNQFTITNTFRRRSQAFVYKMNYKDLEGTAHTVNHNIFGSVTSIADLKISPTGAIRDFKGVLQDWAAGKGMDFAAVSFGPVEIPLEDNETEANFKVRVIGPGMPVTGAMTTYEKERWINLSLQTLTFDFLVPVMLDAVGHKEALGQINSKLVIGKDLGTLEKFLKATGNFVATIPAASDALEAGDYEKAFKEVLFGVENGFASGAVDEWIKALYESIGNAVKEIGSNYIEEQPEYLEKRAEKLVKVLQMMDIGMKLVDYSRITADIARSKALEEWDLKAKEVQLNLTPKEFSVGILEQKMLTAYIKTSLADNTVIEYEWETTGKYGYLWDDRGHKGASFTSSLKEAYYLCNASESDISQGKHSDTIKVTAYLKTGQTRSRIASGTSIANVGKDVFYLGWTRDLGIYEYYQNGKFYFNASAPSFLAEFEEKAGARGYSVEVVDAGGNIVVPVYPNYSTPGVTRENGKVKIRLVIGRVGIVEGGSTQEQLAAAKAKREKILDDYAGKSFKVTVGY